jgi:hypothetical protein
MIEGLITCDGCGMETRIPRGNQPVGWREFKSKGQGYEFCSACAVKADDILSDCWAKLPQNVREYR